MTAVHQLIGIGIKSALAANASLTAIVGGRIFDEQSDAGDLSDKVIFQWMAGPGDENVSLTRSIDCQYMVKGVSPDHDTAETIAGYIDDSMINLAVSGWTVWGLTMGNVISYTEDINGDPYFHRGWMVRIRIEQ